MPSTPKRILVVDDEQSIRANVAMLFTAQGYETSSAEDGFDALLKMKSSMPDMVVSDLNMPHMSGFELLSVLRRRFPEVLVVAMSGAYQAGDAVPGGVIADGFYAKGDQHPDALMTLVTNLLQTSGFRSQRPARKSAPVWVPRNGKDTKGIPYIVLTCTECLRSFPLDVPSEVTATLMETPCIFCLNEVRYIIDFSLSVTLPRIKLETLAVNS